MALLLAVQQVSANVWVADGGTIVQIASSIGVQANSLAGSTDRFAIKVDGGTATTTCQGL